jgi:phage terminase large subunit-like protein
LVLASGLDVINEMKRLYGHEKWGVVPINPKTDKVARVISVQQAFAHHLVYAPDRDFADMVKDEMALFPKGRFKDLTDSANGKRRHSASSHSRFCATVQQIRSRGHNCAWNRHD